MRGSESAALMDGDPRRLVGEDMCQAPRLVEEDMYRAGACMLERHQYKNQATSTKMSEAKYSRGIWPIGVGGYIAE